VLVRLIVVCDGADETRLCWYCHSWWVDGITKGVWSGGYEWRPS